MILINNSPHDNGVYTFINRETGLIIKSSYTEEGISRLKREFAGYQWYFQMSGIAAERTISFAPQSSAHYTRAYIKYFPGTVGDSNERISVNQSLFLQAIEHYVKVWPADKNGLVPVHGDFSVGNIIFYNNTLTIIDWEHFAPDAAPWGFDLVNMLYESVWLSLDGKNEFATEDLTAFKKIQNIIISLLPTGSAFKCTHEHLSEFIYKNASLWGSLIKKFPVLKFTEEQKKYLQTIE